MIEAGLPRGNDPVNPMLDLADIFLFGVLLAVLSVPFVFGLVPRNRYFGFRVPPTLHDDEVWYVTNRRVAYEMIALGVVLAASAIVASERGFGDGARTTLTVLMIGGVAIITIRHWIAAHRLRTDRRTPRTP